MPLHTAQAIPKAISKYLVFTVIALALLVLLGWQFNIGFLKHPFARWSEMNPMSALAFVAAGIAFLLADTRRRTAGSLLFYLTASIPLFVGILKVGGHLLSLEERIDHVLFSAKLTAEATGNISNSMSDNVALNFIASSVAILIVKIETPGKRIPSQYLAVVIAFVSLLSIVAYIYAVPAFQGLSHFPVAVYTAIEFLLLSLAILLYRPYQGMMQVFSSELEGSRVARVLIPAAILVPITLGYLRLLGHWTGTLTVEFGVALLTLSISFIFMVLIGYTSNLLNNRDQLRRASDETIRALNEKFARTAEERFRLIVESAPNALVVINQEGRITLVNKQTEKLFMFSREEMINQDVEMLIPNRYTGKHPGFRTAFFQTPEARPMGIGRDLYAKRKDQTEFPVEIGLNPMETSDGPMVLASIIDITERKKAEERFRLVVESAPNAMILANQEGKITLVNSQTEKLFGYGRNELIGKEVELLIPTRFRDHHPDFRKRFYEKPHSRPMGAGRDLFARRKDGSEFPVEIGLNPIESHDGPMVLASVIDITERRMQEANRLKSDFLANMSHEFRTPLNAVLGFSELLIDKKVGPLNDKQLDYLNDIYASGNHLLKLINDVLDLSKIEAGRTTLILEAFPIAEVIDGVIKSVRPLADKKNIVVVQEIAPEVDTVTMDKNKLRQILYNLLSNAIKFSPNNGSVRIDVLPGEKESFILNVRDTGIGIAKEDLRKLFIPFVQLDSGLSRQHEGSGLGLALTKNIVSLHGGQINVESVLGKGSTFSVVLPQNYKSNQHGTD